MSSKVLPAIEKNPTLFEPLFVYNAEALDAAAIKGLMKPKRPLSDEHGKVWDYLFQFLDECGETGTLDAKFSVSLFVCFPVFFYAIQNVV